MDVVEEKSDFPIYDSIFKIEGKSDVVVDFYNPPAFDNLLKCVLSHRIPVVMGSRASKKAID
ncbi:hypothetical protein [Caldanaerobacter subterraneus]|uniref:hypothetical protein n=1 Tax=Caldanaerobacter subterraneus TaxID=911092 RepID=UPI003F68D7CC